MFCTCNAVRRAVSEVGTTGCKNKEPQLFACTLLRLWQAHCTVAVCLDSWLHVGVVLGYMVRCCSWPFDTSQPLLMRKIIINARAGFLECSTCVAALFPIVTSGPAPSAAATRPTDCHPVAGCLLHVAQQQTSPYILAKLLHFSYYVFGHHVSKCDNACCCDDLAVLLVVLCRTGCNVGGWLRLVTCFCPCWTLG